MSRDVADRVARVRRYIGAIEAELAEIEAEAAIERVAGSRARGPSAKGLEMRRRVWDAEDRYLARGVPRNERAKRIAQLLECSVSLVTKYMAERRTEFRSESLTIPTPLASIESPALQGLDEREAESTAGNL